jgi:hypothetical protein
MLDRWSASRWHASLAHRVRRRKLASVLGAEVDHDVLPDSTLPCYDVEQHLPVRSCGISAGNVLRPINADRCHRPRDPEIGQK